jgi:hypothetical protein
MTTHEEDAMQGDGGANGHPVEGTIHAWLDGELPATEAAALEAHVARCAPCAAAVAEARGLVAGASRVVRTLDDTDAVATDSAPRWGEGAIAAAAPAAVAGTSTARWLRVTPARAAIAATLLVVVGITATHGWVSRDSGVIPPAATMGAMAIDPRSAAIPVAARDPMLDSAIARNVAKAMPPRTMERAPGLDVPAAASAPVEAAATDPSAGARVAEGRRERTMARDMAPVVADNAAATVAGGVPAPASATVLRARAEAATASAPAPWCLRLESPAAGAHFGPLVLPVTVMLAGIGSGELRVMSEDSVALRAASATWKRQQGDSVIARIRSVGAGGILRLVGTGDRLTGRVASEGSAAGGSSADVVARRVSCPQ